MLTPSAFAITFVLVVVFGYFAHRSLHQPWTGKFNQAHMTHHNLLYPNGDFFAETYRDPGKDNTVVIFGLFSIPVLLLPIILQLSGTISLSLMSFVLIEMLGLGFLHNYLHDAFHITNHWLTRFSLYRKWVALHIRHHRDQQKNFGIFTFMMDRLMGTFK